jgi:hypothetical protein
MALIGFVLVIGVLAGMCVLDGLVLKVMWGWFLVPLGFPQIGLAMAIGVGAIISLVSHTPVRKSKKGEEFSDLAEGLINSLLKMAILLAVGWIAHKCM